jgi:threonine-phosphate decarboxylase
MRPEHGGQLKGSRHRSADERAWLDFSVNLNPYAPQPTDAEWLAWRNDIASYPEPTSRCVDRLLEDYLGVAGRGQAISTQGAMEALRLALELQRGRTIHIPAPCFSEYPFLCEQLDLDFRIHVVSEGDWSHGSSWLDMQIEPGSAVLFGNPNNPFGVKASIRDLEPILCRFQENDVTVIVDEAFIEFTETPQEHSLISILADFPNVMIVGSLTKSWSIPGIRLGYLITSDLRNIETLRNRQITWPLNSIVHSWATSMLVEARIAEQRAGMKRLQETKDQLFTYLRDFPFLNVYPSDANYCVCECLSEIDGMIAHLESLQIGVRLCEGIPGLPPGRFIRIGARLLEQNRRLIQALTAFASTFVRESFNKAE